MIAEAAAEVSDQAEASRQRRERKQRYRRLLWRSDDILEEVERLMLRGRQRLPRPLGVALKELWDVVDPGVDHIVHQRVTVALDDLFSLQDLVMEACSSLAREPE